MSRRTETDWARLARLLDAVIDLAPDRRSAKLSELDASPSEIERIEAMLAREETRSSGLNALVDQLADCDQYNQGSGSAGMVLGRWRLVRPLGEGGMASVWLAERADGSVAQQVAVKCLKTGLYSPELRALFVREQQILARLQHPHIARMYDSGIADNGLPYLVMELIDGQPLTDWCDQRRLDLLQRLNLFDQVLDALRFAHRQLIVHRDLKPGNILVDQRGDLKLLDFGIARLLDDESPDAPITRYRGLTPEYAAPEQMAGERVGLAADIYALGLLLHELLTGRRPPRDATERQLHPASRQLGRSTDGFDPVASAACRHSTPSRLKRELKGDLDAIIGRCLAQRPQDRYPDVASLQQDLDAWRQRRPVSARRVGPGRRARLFLTRHWLPSTALAAVLLAMGLGTTVALYEAGRAEAEAEAARAAQARAEAAQARAVAVREFVVELFRGEIPLVPADQLPTTRQIVDRGVARARDPEASPPELRAEMLTVLGEILTSRRQYDEAAELLDEAMMLISSSPEPDESWLAEALENAAHLAHQRRDLGAAQDYVARQVALLEKIAPESEELYYALRVQVSIDLDRQDMQLAEKRLNALIARVEQHEGLAYLQTLLLGDLGVLHARNGDLATAGEAFHRQLELRLADPEERVDVVANTMANLGYLNLGLGQLERAEGYFRQALEHLLPITERPLRPRANAHQGLAEIHWRLARYDQALMEIELGWQEWRRILSLSPEEDHYFPALHRGLILARAGRHEEAVAELGRAWTLMVDSDDVLPRYRAETVMYLSKGHCALGQVEAAAPWLALVQDHLGPDTEHLAHEVRAYCKLAGGAAPDPDQALPMSVVLGDERQLGDLILVVRRELLRAALLDAAGRHEEAHGTRLSAHQRLAGNPQFAEHPLLSTINTLLAESGG